MKAYLYTAYFFLILLTACKNKTAKNYEVSTKDSANFSISGSYIYPDESVKIKVNDKVFFERKGKKSTGSPAFWLYFLYPDAIKKIQVITYYKGKKRQDKIFIDTLMQVKQRSIIISGPFPKGMTKETYKPYGFVPPEKSERLIILVDDADHYKGMWTDNQ